MSRTDKTDPWRLKVERYGWPVGGYSRQLGYFARHCVKEQGNQIERGIRAAWRGARQQLLQVDRDDLDDVELPDPRHRHFALWDRW